MENWRVGELVEVGREGTSTGVGGREGEGELVENGRVGELLEVGREGASTGVGGREGEGA